MRRALLDALVRRVSAGHPGDPAWMVDAINEFYRDHYDSRAGIMGGAGGATVFAQNGALYVRYPDPSMPWHARLEWRAGRWEVTAFTEDEATPEGELAAENAAAQPLVDALAGDFPPDPPGE